MNLVDNTFQRWERVLSTRVPPEDSQRRSDRRCPCSPSEASRLQRNHRVGCFVSQNAGGGRTRSSWKLEQGFITEQLLSARHCVGH